MERNKVFESHIKDLFKQNVSVCFSTAVSSGARLMTEELPGTEKMVEHRLLEFTHGRDCARVVLKNFQGEVSQFGSFRRLQQF